ncbi:preprotein translocase subunit SecE [Flavobacteriaceae bacterium Ap0902]|nr:preprotein translocase subunit SecE [Flavobacteriaceae bacterium Ap0902]
MIMIDFVKGAYYEFTEHVTWPKWSVAQSATIIVGVATVILALFLFSVDTIFSDLINLIYTLLK